MRPIRGYPLVDKHGRIKIESVNRLSFKNLRSWIKAVLRGKDPGAGGRQDDLPYGFLKRVYHQLDPHVREAFEDAVLQHLGEFAHDPESGWHGDSADELLLLVGEIFRDSHRSGAPIDLLNDLTKQKGFHGRGGRKVYKRILQTLVALRYRAWPDFWFQQFEVGGDELAQITLAGLSMIGIEHVVKWAREHASSIEVVNALIVRLPLLVGEYGAEKLGVLLTGLPAQLESSQRNELLRLGNRLGLQLDPLLLLMKTIEELGQEDIEKIGQVFGIETLVEMKTMERLAAIESKLQEMKEEELKFHGIPPDASPAVRFVYRVHREGGLRHSSRQKLWETGKSLVPNLPHEDATDMSAELSSMVIDKRDIAAELRNII